MSIPPFSELYMGMAKIIQNVDPLMRLILKGMPLPELNGIQEFIAFDMLSEVEKASQSLDGDRVYNLQLSCYSLHAEYRDDKSIIAPQKLAEKYKPIIHRANHTIKSSCLRTIDSRIVYLDLRASGDYSKQIYQSSPSYKLHSCVLYTTAHIS